MHVYGFITTIMYFFILNKFLFVIIWMVWFYFKYKYMYEFICILGYANCADIVYSCILFENC